MTEIGLNCRFIITGLEISRHIHNVSCLVFLLLVIQTRSSPNTKKPQRQGHAIFNLHRTGKDASLFWPHQTQTFGLEPMKYDLSPWRTRKKKEINKTGKKKRFPLKLPLGKETRTTHHSWGGIPYAYINSFRGQLHLQWLSWCYFPIINSHLKHTDLIGLSSLLSTGMDLTGSSRVSSCPWAGTGFLPSSNSHSYKYPASQPSWNVRGVN